MWGNTFLTAGTGFIFWTVVARLYQPYHVGLGSASLSAVLLLATMANLGLGYGLIRFLPQAQGQTTRMLNSALTLGAITGGAAALIFLAGLPWWLPSLVVLRGHPIFFLVFFLSGSLETVVLIQARSFVALRNTRYLTALALLHALVKLGLAAILARFFASFGIFASWSIASGMYALAAIWFLRRILPTYRPYPALDRGCLGQLLGYSISNQLSDLFQALPFYLLPLLVVGILDPEKAGYFYIAWAVGTLLISLPASLALSLFAEGSHNEGELHLRTAGALAVALGVAVVGALGVYLLGEKVLLLFGRAYAANAAELLQLVALAAVPAAGVNIYLTIERVRKGIRNLLLVTGTMAIGTLVTSWLLLPRLGLAGAGIGLVAGYGSAAALALALFLWQRARALRPAPSTVVAAK